MPTYELAAVLMIALAPRSYAVLNNPMAVIGFMQADAIESRFALSGNIKDSWIGTTT
jgi:hypothetical protein